MLQCCVLPHVRRQAPHLAAQKKAHVVGVRRNFELRRVAECVRELRFVSRCDQQPDIGGSGICGVCGVYGALERA